MFHILFFKSHKRSILSPLHNMTQLYLWIFLLYLSNSYGVHLPKTFKTCSRNDPDINQCFNKAAVDGLPHLAKGYPPLGFPALEPLEIKEFSVKQGDGPVSVNLKYTNVKFFNMSIIEPSFNVDLAKKVITGWSLNPTVRMEGDYEVDGRVLVLPIKGKGKAMVEMRGINSSFNIVLVEKKKKDVDYLLLKSFSYNQESADQMSISLTNLFNGDKQLGEATNGLLNENWRDVYGSMKPAFNRVLTILYNDLLGRVFNNVPYDELFPVKV